MIILTSDYASADREGFYTEKELPHAANLHTAIPGQVDGIYHEGKRMSVPRFELRAAAALFLERQWLDRPRGRRLSESSLDAFARATGGIQLDSINVVERAHHLTLWSRFGPYRLESLRRLIEERRVLFEYWAHVACLIATSDFPAWRRAMLDYRHRHKGWAFLLEKHRDIIPKVEQAIREHGPIGNSYFSYPTGEAAGGWWNWKPATHALDWMFMSGRITVHSRVHFHKRFDLMERVLPEALAREPLSAAAFKTWHLRRSLTAMGAATETDLRLYLTYPRMRSTERRAVFQEAVRTGEVVEIALEGDHGRWFVLRDDLPALEAAARKRAPSKGSALLAPFDSFLWHRERTRRLFGLDYRIEVYTPDHKRTHGYYTLPMLVDGYLIGRADVKTHRGEGVLELRRVQFEPWLVAGDPPPAASWKPLALDRALAGVAEAAHSLAAFVGATRVQLSRTAPTRLHAPLRRSLEAAAADAPRRAERGGRARGNSRWRTSDSEALV